MNQKRLTKALLYIAICCLQSLSSISSPLARESTGTVHCSTSCLWLLRTTSGCHTWMATDARLITSQRGRLSFSLDQWRENPENAAHLTLSRFLNSALAVFSFSCSSPIRNRSSSSLLECSPIWLSSFRTASLHAASFLALCLSNLSSAPEISMRDRRWAEGGEWKKMGKRSVLGPVEGLGIGG